MSATTMVAADDSPSDATRSVHTRNTKGGRRLHYELTCLQQPERARACGSGQKSAADRRPVDPPPVVQLRVLEGPTLEDSKDITLGYNANFFVYVDLQHARPIANGRVQTPAATTPPVLTGAPVSGMAYLDRPAEAGYFLFPDLSVRHEGRYVLGFSLYEELKDEMDQDADPVDDDSTPGFYLRMKVQSAPFVVFSAKKFPGLTSSTTLSRTISEQGCRVRIRRDVRMRRRDGKPSGGDYEKEEEAARSRRTQTPDIRKDQMRGRSVSNSSEQRAPYSAVSERRPSEMDAYPAPPPPPPAPITVPIAHSRYGSDASSNGYAPTPHSNRLSTASRFAHIWLPQRTAFAVRHRSARWIRLPVAPGTARVQLIRHHTHYAPGRVRPPPLSFRAPFTLSRPVCLARDGLQEGFRLQTGTAEGRGVEERLADPHRHEAGYAQNTHPRDFHTAAYPLWSYSWTVRSGQPREVSSDVKRHRAGLACATGSRTVGSRRLQAWIRRYVCRESAERAARRTAPA